MVKFNKNHSIIILFIVIFILFISYYINYKYTIKKEPFYFTCTMTLDNVSPQMVNNYLKFNNQQISCSDCTNGTLKMVVNPCPQDENGVPDSSCKQKATIETSSGNPVVFTYDITPKNISRFFCINLDKTIPTESEDTSENTSEDNSEDTPKNTGKDTPKNTGKDTPKNTGKDTPKNTGKDTPKNTEKGTPKNTSKNNANNSNNNANNSNNNANNSNNNANNNANNSKNNANNSYKKK
jgi:hypothetical protein